MYRVDSIKITRQEEDIQNFSFIIIIKIKRND